jgi:hypothetical protein
MVVDDEHPHGIHLVWFYEVHADRNLLRGFFGRAMWMPEVSRAAGSLAITLRGGFCVVPCEHASAA